MRGSGKLDLVRGVLVPMLLLYPALAFAHERFVKHGLKQPLHDEFFRRHAGQFLGMHPSMLRIALNATFVLAAFLALWFVRRWLEEAVDARFVGAGGRVQRVVHALVCFASDRPVPSKIFRAASEWFVIMFLRVPGLVLMYSAANNALVMPSYPLEPNTEFFFKMVQVVLAVLILTQTLLPLCGALLVGTWLYLSRWGWLVAADALPVLSVAVVYMSSPWESHKRTITSISELQTRWIRLTLGFGFFVLGWLKIYNHDLVAGVADQYPSILEDPMTKLLALGADPALRRETWVVSFALAEVMSGFMLMTGTFTRVWATIMAFVFTKLMLVDFGWNEIPHLFPIGALTALAFNNGLHAELEPLVLRAERAGRHGRVVEQAAIIGVTAVGVAVVLIFPTIYGLTFVSRTGLR
ncbi:MAG: DoxX family membrane protein [Labilithrix sp.]